MVRHPANYELETDAELHRRGISLKLTAVVELCKNQNAGCSANDYNLRISLSNGRSIAIFRALLTPISKRGNDGLQERRILGASVESPVFGDTHKFKLWVLLTRSRAAAWMPHSTRIWGERICENIPQ
jgi:hypothetical protein